MMPREVVLSLWEKFWILYIKRYPAQNLTSAHVDPECSESCMNFQTGSSFKRCNHLEMYILELLALTLNK